MNSYNLESFISFCDEMQIAEEALGNVTTIADTLNKRVYILKAKLNDAKTPKDKIKVISELKSYLIKYKSDIEKVKPNLFDTKFAKILAKSLGLAVSVILIPCTAGLSIMGVVGFSTDISTTKTVNEMKKELISGIDSQIKNCDVIIKYLKSNDVATEGMKEFIQNRKHIHSIRKENKEVRNEYKKLKNNLSKNDPDWPSNSQNKFDDLSRKANTNKLIKENQNEKRVLTEIGNLLISEFNKVIKDITNGKYKVQFNSKFDCDDGLQNIIHGDEASFQNMYNNDHDMFIRVVRKLDDVTRRVYEKYKKYNPDFYASQDETCHLVITLYYFDY